MNKKLVYLVIGGDLRQSYLAKNFVQNNKVYSLGLVDEKVDDEIICLDSISDLEEKVDIIVLPLPVTNDGVNINIQTEIEKVSLYSILPCLNTNAVIFGGKIGSEAAIFNYKGFEVIDYLSREELSVLNAIPTCEGAIALAMEELPTTIYGQNVLIAGFGRISKVMVKALNGFGAKITITARKYSDLAWANILGCEAVHINDIDSHLKKFDLLFNTAPATIFDEKKLLKLKESCLVIDLASKPGGVDFEVASKLGIKTIWALSLPGKVAPITSGNIIADTIQNILIERGEI